MTEEGVDSLRLALQQKKDLGEVEDWQHVEWEAQQHLFGPAVGS